MVRDHSRGVFKLGFKEHVGFGRCLCEKRHFHSRLENLSDQILKEMHTHVLVRSTAVRVARCTTVCDGPAAQKLSWDFVITGKN